MGKLDNETENVEDSAKGATDAFKGLAAVGIAIAAVRAAKAIGRLTLSLVDAASDAEETRSKFLVTFRGIEGAANETAEALARDFGLASSSAESLLANTGDLLTGFGFSRDAALDLATQVQELSVDLASFTNFSGGAIGASEAITKALLGERESVKALGISILEADIQQLAEDKGIVGELTRQQKAALTLEIAIRQSGNAIGDFARTSQGTANQRRVLAEDIKTLSEGFGRALLPAADAVIAVLRDMVGFFNSLDDDMKKTIITSAAIAIGITGVGIAIGVAIPLVKIIRNKVIELNLAMSANPAGALALAIGAVVAAITVALPFIINARRRHKEYQDQLTNTATAMNLLSLEEQKAFRARAAQDLETAIRNQSRFRRELASATEEHAVMVESMIGLRNVSREGGEALAKLAIAVRDSEAGYEQATEDIGRYGQAVTAARASIQELEEAILPVIPEVEDLGDALGDGTDAADKFKDIHQAIVVTLRNERSALERDRLAVLSLVEAQRKLAEFERLRQAQDGEDPTKKGGLEAVIARGRRAQREAAEEAAQMQIAADELARQSADDRAAIIDGIIADQKEHDEAIRASADAYIAQQKRIQAEDEETARKREDLRRIQLRVAQTIGEGLVTIAENASTREGETQRQAAIRARDFGLARVAIATAVAIAEAGLITPAALAAGVEGLIQAAIVASTPIPAAQFGGSFVVPPGNERDSGLVRVNSGERVDVSSARDSGGMPSTMILRVGEREIFGVVEDAFNKGGAQIRRASAIKTR